VPHPRLVRVAGALTGANLLLLAACSDDAATSAPEDLAPRLAAARDLLDGADSLRLRLVTPALPDGTEGLIEADGVGTHAPAFEGTVTVVSTGLGLVDAELVSVEGDVVARIGFVPEFNPIDPADYGAPDPALLVSADGGVSSWLTATEDLVAGSESRDGDEVLTSVSGTLPGDVVQPLIPSADETAAFDVDYRLTDDDVLRDAQISGPFYTGADDVTYDLSVTASDEPVDITLP